MGYGIGSFQAAVGKLRSFDGDVIKLESFDRAFFGFVQERFRRNFYEIVVGDFGDEWKRAGGPDVAFDHFDGIVNGDELDIEGAGNAEGFDNVPGDFFCAAYGLHIRR